MSAVSVQGTSPLRYARISWDDQKTLASWHTTTGLRASAVPRERAFVLRYSALWEVLSFQRAVSSTAPLRGSRCIFLYLPQMSPFHCIFTSPRLFLYCQMRKSIGPFPDWSLWHVFYCCPFSLKSFLGLTSCGAATRPRYQYGFQSIHSLPQATRLHTAQNELQQSSLAHWRPGRVHYGELRSGDAIYVFPRRIHYIYTGQIHAAGAAFTASTRCYGLQASTPQTHKHD